MKIGPTLWILLSGLVAKECPAQPVPELERMLTETHRVGGFNGVALIAQHGQVLLEKTLGPADATRRSGLTMKHRFSIGSVGKEFSAVVIARLAERGKLSVDAPVSSLLDGYPPWARSVTVRMLLDYSSGLPEMNWRGVKSDADVRADLLRLEHTTFAPGTGYAYTYNNVMLRQFIVEQATHKPFAASLRALFARCGMRDSLVDPPADAKRIARAYSDAFVADPTDMPVTGIAFVTAADLYRWSHCLDAGRAINADSLFMLGQAARPDNGALGNTRWDGRQLLVHSHQGESRNYEALLRFTAQRDSTIVLLANNKQQKLEAIADAAEAILDGRDYQQPR
jgi:CubicO group peptidase (beta-lactamase class C family)